MVRLCGLGSRRSSCFRPAPPWSPVAPSALWSACVGIQLDALSPISCQLMMASENGHLDVVRVLLDKGAEINNKTGGGTTALMIPSQNGYRDIVRALLEKGAEVNTEENDGPTVLFLAAENGHVEVVWALLNKGAEVNANAEMARPR